MLYIYKYIYTHIHTPFSCQFLLQLCVFNTIVLRGIHFTIHLCKCLQTTRSKIALKHQRSTTILYCVYQVLFLAYISLTLKIMTLYMGKKVSFGLIWPQDTIPVEIQLPAKFRHCSLWSVLSNGFICASFPKRLLTLTCHLTADSKVWNSEPMTPGFLYASLIVFLIQCGGQNPHA